MGNKMKLEQSAQPRLILHPCNPTADPPLLQLQQTLEQIALIAEPLRFGDRRHWRPGEAFLRRITFLGCSPVVALGEPGATGDSFCHIAIEGPWPAARFRTTRQRRDPRCRHCRTPLTGSALDAALQQWQQQPLTAPPHHCSGCGRDTPLPALDWRGIAGFGRLFIDIFGIFEGEAVPDASLLQSLAALTGGEWRYFYQT